MDKIAGSLFGLAYGDALGAETEFWPYARIVKEYELPGPMELKGQPAQVTDDTQMMLAVADAVVDARSADGVLAPDAFELRTRERFLAWWYSPDNNRAPGNTCLGACEALAAGLPWVNATRKGSKGCGANMRTTPLGLVDVPRDVMLGAAQLQAAMTHGHPTALAASDLTTVAVWALRTGLAPKELPGFLRQHAVQERQVYRGDWLGDELWRGPFGTTPEEFIARGWDECLEVLDRLDTALVVKDRRADPCNATGQGWIAEEALATAVLCFLLYEGEPVKAIARGAATGGDSDSIAAIAGALAGAAYGMDCWPEPWADQIEYGYDLRRLSALL